MNIRSSIFAAFAAFVLPLTLSAQGIADLANPDDIMLRKPAKPVAQPEVKPVVQPVAKPAVRMVNPAEMPSGIRPGETPDMARARAVQAQQRALAADQAAANARLLAQKLAAEKAAAEKLAAEKTAAEKAAAEQAAAAKAQAELKEKEAAAAKAQAERKEQENAAELAKLREQVAASEKARQQAVKAQEQAEQAKQQAEQKIVSEQVARQQAEAQAKAEHEAADAAKARAQEAEAAALAAKKKKLEAPVRVGDVAGAAPEAAKKKPGSTIKVKKTLTGRPAVITADRTDYDRKEGVILFDRNVYVDDEQYQMHADRLFVFLDGTNDLKRIVALGNVSITNESKTAACAKAVYSRADQRIIMFGENEQNLAWLRDAGSKKGDSSEISGMRITYWFDSEIATVEGVKVTVPGIKGSGSPKDLFGPNLGGKGEKKKDK